MLSTNEALKILNNNNQQKKYTQEEASKIKLLLYQFGEIAYLQFKPTEINGQKRSIVYQSIN